MTKNKKLFIVSRARYFITKENIILFENQDGPYIDKISSYFKNTTILSLAQFEYAENIKYKFNSENNINVIPISKKAENIHNLLYERVLEIKTLYKEIKKADTVFVFIPQFNSFLATIIAKLLQKDIISYSGFTWKNIVNDEKKYKSKIKRYIFDKLEKIVIKLSDIKVMNNNELYKKYSYMDFLEKTKPLSTLKLIDADYIKNKSFNKSQLNIISVGHILERKGHIITLEAFNKIKKEHSINLKLHIVGKIVDKNYFNLLNKFIIDNSLENDVIFEGYKSSEELAEILKKMDIFILSSFAEGFPRVIWEAMLFKIPVITSKLDNIIDEFNQEKNPLCLFYEIKNNKDLSEKISIVIENDQLRNSIIKNSHNYVNTIYNEKAYEQVLRLYNKYLEKKEIK